VDARSDIFSLGMVIYEMVAGRSPFIGDTNSDIVASILKEEPPRLSDLAADVPDELEISSIGRWSRIRTNAIKPSASCTAI
jgi:serine/threonine-protein kinase